MDPENYFALNPELGALPKLCLFFRRGGGVSILENSYTLHPKSNRALIPVLSRSLTARTTGLSPGSATSTAARRVEGLGLIRFRDIPIFFPESMAKGFMLEASSFIAVYAC